MTIDTLEIQQGLEAHFRTLVKPRGDERFAHVSDMYACDFETHTRRQPGYKPSGNRDGEGSLRMALGNNIEGYIAEGLAALYKDFDTVNRGERIAWNPATGAARRGLYEHGHSVRRGKATKCTGCTDCTALEGELIGHIDFSAVSFDGEDLYEVKSTSFYGKPPSTPKEHYVEQAAGYGVAIKAARAGILIADRTSCKIAGPFWLDFDALPPVGVFEDRSGERMTLREAAIERGRNVLALTDPEAFPPSPKPRFSWQPKYCNLAVCACAGGTTK
jgi:hypothetical protein